MERDSKLSTRKKKLFRLLFLLVSPYTRALARNTGTGIGGCLGPIYAILALCYIIFGYPNVWVYDGWLIAGPVMALTILGWLGAPFELIAYHVERVRRRLAADVINSPADVTGDFTLYLRTFQTDRKAAKFQYTEQDRARERGIAYTEEELLCSTVGRAFGRVIALGRPEELLPEVGASRMYAQNEQWRGYVEALTSKARLVMIQLNEGKWTEWELVHVAKNVQRSRVVILVPAKIHGKRLLKKLFDNYSTSPGMREAYAKHCVALQNSEPSRRGQKAEPGEYFSIICFDGNGVAYCQSVKWGEEPVEMQNLVKSLALQTLFSLYSKPLSARTGTGIGCCRRPLVKPHLRMYCKKTDEQCSEAVQEAWKIHEWSLGRWALQDPCCPHCLTERRAKEP